MSVTPDPITYTELTFPDITGKTIGAYALLTFSGAAYTLGGIPANLMKFADVRTVDFNGFLKADFYGEDPYNAATGIGTYRYIYSPVTDTLQIVSYITGLELAAGSTLPAGVTSDTVLVHAVWDRTSTRG
jgi:hypothetical protein